MQNMDVVTETRRGLLPHYIVRYSIEIFRGIIFSNLLNLTVKIFWIWVTLSILKSPIFYLQLWRVNLKDKSTDKKLDFDMQTELSSVGWPGEVEMVVRSCSDGCRGGTDQPSQPGHCVQINCPFFCGICDQTTTKNCNQLTITWVHQLVIEDDNKAWLAKCSQTIESEIEHIIE